MFTQEELNNFYGVLQTTQEFIEIECGCTNPRYGDTPGKLSVYVDGRFQIDCTCRDDCNMVNVSRLVEFARHGGRINAHVNWKSQIWVFTNDGHKVALWKTCLVKHHTSTFQRPLLQVVHRDKFREYSPCHKKRRFIVRTKEANGIYHDSVVNKN